MIGIVGGVGPYAGLDLMKKVFDNTLAHCDQDHVDALLFSHSSKIVDRTEYLEGREKDNPAEALSEVLIRLDQAGAIVAGIPCNTAHAAPIFDLILDRLQARGARISLLHMVRETVIFIRAHAGDIGRVGVLSTTGTYHSGVYREALLAEGFEVILPTPEMQDELIHPAIYHRKYGIKTQSTPVDPRAIENLQKGVDYLRHEGAQALIMGCTEIPLVKGELEMDSIRTVDPTEILARALINFAFPDKLKPLQNPLS
jgi:aspartate racemase